MRIRFTISADGTSDAVLNPIVEWLLTNDHPEILPVVQFTGPTSRTLHARLGDSLRLFPCDILLIHRDAENAAWTEREAEIRTALGNLVAPPASVFVVPVRMTESWLLTDEAAIRRAAGNPRGRVPLDLPRTHELERLADPKERLHSALKLASEFTGRRLKQFHSPAAARLVAQHVTSFEPLSSVGSFSRFGNSLREALGILTDLRQQ